MNTAIVKTFKKGLSGYDITFCLALDEMESPIFYNTPAYIQYNTRQFISEAINKVLSVKDLEIHLIVIPVAKRKELPFNPFSDILKTQA